MDACVPALRGCGAGFSQEKLAAVLLLLAHTARAATTSHSAVLVS
jgi:hypothetical protein